MYHSRFLFKILQVTWLTALKSTGTHCQLRLSCLCPARTMETGSPLCWLQPVFGSVSSPAAVRMILWRILLVWLGNTLLGHLENSQTSTVTSPVHIIRVEVSQDSTGKFS